MALLALGINHKTASVEVRETVAFAPAQIETALAEAGRMQGVDEIAILSTCNRTEIYCACQDTQAESLLQWLSEYHRVDLQELKRSIYLHSDEEAVRHIMRVASGLDSLVLGEPQILGQLKTSYLQAQSAKTAHAELNRLFQQAFTTAKDIRTQTAIGQNPVSVAYAAVSLAQRIFADLSSSRALLIGAGETIELVARHLVATGVKDVVVANRTLARAEQLANQFGGRSVVLEDIPDVLADADIVISSTASPLPIVGKGTVERALKKRKHSPIFMVDIAVPRDIEEEVGELADVYLYTVDDLQDVIEENRKSRESAAEEAEVLIEAGTHLFMERVRELDAVETLKALRHKAEATRDLEIQRAKKLLEKGRDPEEVLYLLARGLTNKLLHKPTVQMKKASAEGRPDVLGITHELFDLTPEDFKDTP